VPFTLETELNLKRTLVSYAGMSGSCVTTKHVYLLKKYVCAVFDFKLLLDDEKMLDC
jgi:hypothetical protein